MEQEYFNKIVDFLSEIGIQTIDKDLDEDTFLPGITLGANCIYIDKNKLLYPGDILHEAGHVAICASDQRSKIGTDQMQSNWPDQGEEIGAILWSYAALRKLDIPINYVFHPNGYKGNSDWFIERFENEDYIGLPLLEWKGMALTKEKANQANKPAFPEMINWLSV